MCSISSLFKEEKEAAASNVFRKKRNDLLLDKWLARNSEREQTCSGRDVAMEEQVAFQEK